MVTIMEDVKSTNIPSRKVGIWWIGQAGYIIKTPKNKVIFIDAFLYGEKIRMIPPPLKPEEIECDIYVCTHNHNDHADLKSIAKIRKKEEMIFIGPKNVVNALMNLDIKQNNIHEVNVGDFIELYDIKIRGTFCIPTDDTVLDAEGFLLQTEDDITIYHTGDTGFHDFLFYLSKYPIDVMIVCINGGMGNMNIEEAVKLSRFLHPKVVIPSHYGMFAGNTADPFRFMARLNSSGAEAPCKILKIGEKYIYSR